MVWFVSWIYLHLRIIRDGFCKRLLISIVLDYSSLVNFHKTAVRITCHVPQFEIRQSCLTSDLADPVSSSSSSSSICSLLMSKNEPAWIMVIKVNSKLCPRIKASVS